LPSLAAVVTCYECVCVSVRRRARIVRSPGRERLRAGVREANLTGYTARCCRLVADWCGQAKEGPVRVRWWAEMGTLCHGASEDVE
jgi:hypothetical protein